MDAHKSSNISENENEIFEETISKQECPSVDTILINSDRERYLIQLTTLLPFLSIKRLEKELGALYCKLLSKQYNDGKIEVTINHDYTFENLKYAVAASLCFNLSGYIARIIPNPYDTRILNKYSIEIIKPNEEKGLPTRKERLNKEKIYKFSVLWYWEEMADLLIH